MGKYDETTCYCALNRIFGAKPKIAYAIIDALGSASALFELDKEGLDLLLGPYSEYKGQICPLEVEKSGEELSRLEHLGCHFLPSYAKGFPPLLMECEDSPLGLYYKSASSAEEIFLGRELLSIVGTRDISPYGAQWCENIVSSLQGGNKAPTIVSGLAIGVDITAHCSALDKGMPTIAVLPTGIDDVYPHRHEKEAERISSSEGCALVTDFPPGTLVQRYTFLRRNRIIAGLSKATILIESRIKGGGMMTANLAFTYGRDVYALPGRVDDGRSQGCNSLIRMKIAEAISDTACLRKSLGLGSKRSSHEEISPSELYGEGSTEQAILQRVQVSSGIGIEELCEELSLPYGIAAQAVARLEADGLITVDLLQHCYRAGFRF